MPALTDIALDAMGSDEAPGPEIRGAILACRAFPVRVHLIGPEAKLRAGLGVLGRRVPIDIVHTDEWITMEDKAAKAVREKRNSTMRLGLKMVKERAVAGFREGREDQVVELGDACVLLELGVKGRGEPYQQRDEGAPGRLLFIAEPLHSSHSITIG